MVQYSLKSSCQSLKNLLDHLFAQFNTIFHTTWAEKTGPRGFPALHAITNCTADTTCLWPWGSQWNQPSVFVFVCPVLFDSKILLLPGTCIKNAMFLHVELLSSCQLPLFHLTGAWSLLWHCGDDVFANSRLDKNLWSIGMKCFASAKREPDSFLLLANNANGVSLWWNGFEGASWLSSAKVHRMFRITLPAAFAANTA